MFAAALEVVISLAAISAKTAIAMQGKGHITMPNTFDLRGLINLAQVSLGITICAGLDQEIRGFISENGYDPSPCVGAALSA